MTETITIFRQDSQLRNKLLEIKEQAINQAIEKGRSSKNILQEVVLMINSLNKVAEQLNPLNARLQSVISRLDTRNDFEGIENDMKEASAILDDMKKACRSDYSFRAKRGKEFDSIGCEEMLSADGDGIEHEERRVRALKDEGSKLKLKPRPDIEHIADIATQLLSVNEIVNDDHKERFESNIRKLCHDFSERLNILHRFLGTVIDIKSLDSDKWSSYFMQFHRIVSSPLGHDKRIAEIHKIVTTEIGQWRDSWQTEDGRSHVISNLAETPVVSSDQVMGLLQEMKDVVDYICMFAVKLARGVAWHSGIRMGILTGRILGEEDIIDELNNEDIIKLREKLARAYTNLANSGLGRKEELHY